MLLQLALECDPPTNSAMIVRRVRHGKMQRSKRRKWQRLLDVEKEV